MPNAVPLAAETLSFFQNADLGTGAPSAFTSVVGEPSVGNNSSAVFQTGNWYAALSTDNGTTFSFVNPFTTFPSVNGGFCCDQSVIYERNRELLFWLMLYSPNQTTNTLRLAIAKGASALASGTWYYYDVTPQMVGLPSGRWFDYPHMALSKNFLYITSNVFTTASDSWTNSVIIRLPLNMLSAQTSLTLEYYVTNNHFNFTAAQGATTRMYWGSQSLTSWQIRLYQWDDSSPTVSWTDLAISPYPFSASTCPGPDGKDWCGRVDDRILGAWVANGIIGFMWTASQGSGYPYPHIRAARFNESTKALIDQPFLWSSNFAWAYPAVGVNARGHIAGPVFSGGGTTYPTLNIFIWDDLSPDPVTSGWETYGVLASTNGPTANKWGDYLESRRHFPYGTTWIGTGFTLQGGGANSNARPRYLWFGRERDSPSATLVDHYYQSILRRPPDPPGKTFWEGEVVRILSLGMDLKEAYRVMAGQFFDSPEYLSFNRPDADFVTDLYRTFFQRDPDSGGFNFWLNEINQGFSRALVMNAFVFSSEFESFMTGLYGDTSTRGEVYAVVDFYRGILGRLADNSGFTYWLNRFRTAQCQGTVTAEVENISKQFVESPEYLNRGRNNAQYVGDLYYAFMRRYAGPSEVGFWLDELTSGRRTRDRVRQDFVASPEFQGRVGAILTEGCLQ